MKLREALRQTLANWRNDLPVAWKSVFAEVQPCFEAVHPDLEHEAWEPIFPTRKGKRILGAPRGAHIFRAFDGLPPANVRAVLLGQDPYPNIAHATGRAFEQGDLKDWLVDEDRVTLSLRRIVQAVADNKVNHRRYVHPRTGWPAVIRDLRTGAFQAPAPNEMFDRWHKQGCLLLNLSLTMSRFGPPDEAYPFNGHIPLWRPIIERLASFLVERREGQVVFLLWGSRVQSAFRSFGIQSSARALGAWRSRVRIVAKGHPGFRIATGTPSFLTAPNPFRLANRALCEMGAEQIDW